MCICANIDWRNFLYTETVIRMRVLQDDEICFTSMSDRSK